LFKVSSGVSKKYTCRIWPSIGSTPSAAPVRLLSDSGTVSFSSTVSAPLSSGITSAS
jgi:hypothetical protein